MQTRHLRSKLVQYRYIEILLLDGHKLYILHSFFSPHISRSMTYMSLNVVVVVVVEIFPRIIRSKKSF